MRGGWKILSGRAAQVAAGNCDDPQGGFNGGPFESGDVGLRLIGRDGLWHSRRLCCAARGFFADATAEEAGVG
jgi:hypothetical protein